MKPAYKKINEITSKIGKFREKSKIFSKNQKNFYGSKKFLPGNTKEWKILVK